MLKCPKKSVSFRLSEDTVRELSHLVKRYDVSQAKLLSVLIHFVNVGEDMDQLQDWLEIAKLG